MIARTLVPTLLLVALAGAAAAEGPTPIRLWREYEPVVGRRVTLDLPEGRRALWEMTQAIEVRVRTLPGLPLTPAERAGVRALALDCPVGTARGLSEGTGLNGTYVVHFECAWLRSPSGPPEALPGGRAGG